MASPVFALAGTLVGAGLALVGQLLSRRWRRQDAADDAMREALSSAADLLLTIRTGFDQLEWWEQQRPAYDDVREIDSYIRDLRQLEIHLLRIQDERLRSRLVSLANSLWWLTPVASASGQDEPAVGDDLCEYALSLIGAGLRGEKVRPEPTAIRQYRERMEASRSTHLREYHDWVESKRRAKHASGS